jgi:hypothetical protein
MTLRSLVVVTYVSEEQTASIFGVDHKDCIISGTLVITYKITRSPNTHTHTRVRQILTAVKTRSFIKGVASCS